MKRSGVLISIGIIVLVGIALFIAAGSERQRVTRDPIASPATQGQKLMITDIVKGTGAIAQPGKTLVVHYKGTLEDGTEFDSSYGRGTPFSFVLGQGSVIQGWEQGFEGMQVGGKRRLVVPPELGYGPRGIGSIPPNATLIFEVELLDVK